MRQLGPRAKRDRMSSAARRKTAGGDDAHHGRSSTRHIAVVTFLQRTFAVLVALVAYAFLYSAPHPPSTALGIAYAVSGLCLAVAAWRLWWPTMR
jgi:hypothetical protein